jgi:hypothetical protein
VDERAVTGQLLDHTLKALLNLLSKVDGPFVLLDLSNLRYLTLNLLVNCQVNRVLKKLADCHSLPPCFETNSHFEPQEFVGAGAAHARSNLLYWHLIYFVIKHLN